MRIAQATTPLYVRLNIDLNTSMKEVVKASPDKYKTVAEFVRVAITSQLKKEGRKSQAG
jgi:Arc/MetJ-type ribon-helix-helix transcriptional regulator